MQNKMTLPCIVPAKTHLVDTFYTYDGPADFVEAIDSEQNAAIWPSRFARSWASGGMSFTDARAAIISGRIDAAAKSDRLLDKLDGKFSPPAQAFKGQPAVSGGVPIVPAYLAGQPLAMRIRRRTESQAAPLIVVVDLSSSASIPTDVIEMRGAAILALVRALAARRPVTLWAGCCVGHKEQGHRFMASFCRIESSPLDLARAAHMLTHVSVSRGFHYTLLMENESSKGSLKWAWDSVDTERLWMHKTLERVFAASGETMLHVPAMHNKDSFNTSHPERWISDMLTKYGTADAAEAAA